MCDNCEELYSESQLLKKRCAHLRETVASYKKESQDKDQKILNQREEIRVLNEKMDKLHEETLQLSLYNKNLKIGLKVMEGRYLAAEAFINNLSKQEVMCMVEMPPRRAAAGTEKK